MHDFPKTCKFLNFFVCGSLQHYKKKSCKCSIPFLFIETWCNDDPVCAKYTEANCNEDWLKVNCPKKCKICSNGQ